MSNRQDQQPSYRNNTAILIMCVGVIGGMAGLSYAAVPLYQMFCQVTGYGGTTQVAEGYEDVEILDKTINVRFDASKERDLNWKFKPTQRQVTIRYGEQKQITYTAKNLSDHTITAMATYNVTPQQAGIYFNKIECFCFTETTLQPGEKIEMPVLFYVDPDMVTEVETKNIGTITLSYTFFEEKPEEEPVAALPGKQDSKS